MIKLLKLLARTVGETLKLVNIQESEGLDDVTHNNLTMETKFMTKKILAWSRDLVLIALVILATYLFVPVPSALAQFCPRINTNCSYRVESWHCGGSVCSTYNCASGRCCFSEFGPCIYNPENYGYSQICGGLCGDISGP
jgi:hypothetical protein